MGKKATEWKISVKSEDDLFADKHKLGKIGKIFCGVFVCVFILAIVYIGYITLSEKEEDTFKSYIRNDKYEEAVNCYNYEQDYRTLVEEISNRKIEYDKTKDAEVLSRMWGLIYHFESIIRVTDKVFYEDLKYFPKEKKIVRIGYEINSNNTMLYMEEYLENMMWEKIYDDNSLYNYYIDVEIVRIKNMDNVSEDVHMVSTNTGYDVMDDTEEYVKEFAEMVEEGYFGYEKYDILY